MPSSAPPQPVRLSKSRIQSGRQCPKRLWLELHQREAIQWGGAAQFRMDEGTRFGELARALLGGGILIEADHRHPKQALADTERELARPLDEAPMLFEAAFEFQNVMVRVDGYHRRGEGITLIEVKSTTRVKEEHIWDCAIQTWVARGAGRNVDRVVLAHVNSEFVYEHEGEYSGILVEVDITSDVEALIPSIPGIVSSMASVAGGPKPDIPTGPQCTNPYGCPCLAHCRSEESPQPEYPIEILPRIGRLLGDLQDGGFRDLRDVPPNLLRHKIHRRIADATKANRAFVSPELEGLLRHIPYPRYYVDFETISYVVPRWRGTSPFQAIPFQFSCHKESASGELEHTAFLDVTGQSPLRPFVEALLDSIGSDGPLLVWNATFEATRLKELAELFPEFSDRLLLLSHRMVDLYRIYTQHYYHPAQRGSWSIKAVLPTIAPELSYKNLDIGDGQAAQEGYLRAVAAMTTAGEKEELKAQLLNYCELDTLAMVRLANWRPT